MKRLTLIFVTGLLPVIALAQAAHPHETTAGVTEAIAVLVPTKGSCVRGIVMFEVVKCGVRVVASICGLTPGKHGFSHP